MKLVAGPKTMKEIDKALEHMSKGQKYQNVAYGPGIREQFRKHIESEHFKHLNDKFMYGDEIAMEMRFERFTKKKSFLTDCLRSIL